MRTVLIEDKNIIAKITFVNICPFESDCLLNLLHSDRECYCLLSHETREELFIKSRVDKRALSTRTKMQSF